MKRLLLFMMQIFLLAIGGLYVFVGLHDMLVAPAGSQRLLGATIGVTGSCLTLAALALCRMRRSSPRAPRVVLSLLIGAVPGSLMVANQVLSISWGHSTLLWATSAAIPLVRATLLIRHKVPVAGGRSANVLLSAAVVASAVQVVVPSMYVPVRKGDAFNIEAKIRPSGTEPAALANSRGATATPMRAFEVSVTLTNDGDATLVMLTGAYAVRHELPRFEPDGNDGSWYEPSRARSNLEETRWVAASEQPVTADLVETGTDLVNRGDVLAPGGKWVANWFTYLPDVTTGRLVLDVAIATARQDALDVVLDEADRQQGVEHTDDNGYLAWSSLKVTETSWVNQLCRDGRHAWVEALMPPLHSDTSLAPEGRSFDVTAYMAVNRRTTDPTQAAWWNATNERLSRIYGIRKFDDQYTLSLWPADPGTDTRAEAADHEEPGEQHDPRGK